MSKKLFLGLIILLGFLLRTWHLSNNPPGFFADEADIGFSAYQLLTTGKVAGENPSFYMPSFGIFRPSFSVFAAILPIAVLGLNEQATRLMPALFGTISLIFLYFLVREIFNDQLTALLSAFLLAISPWHIHFSRSGFEYVYFPTLFTLGLYLLIKGVRSKNWLLPAGLIFLGLTFYTYHPAVIQTSLFLILLFPFIIKRIGVRNFIWGVIVFLIMAIPLAVGVKNGRATGRFQQLFTIGGGQETLIQATRHSAVLYLKQFSPSFLFKQGDIDYPSWNVTRHAVRGMGELYWWQMPLLLLGVLFLIKNRRKQNLAGTILLIWFFIYPFGNLFNIDSTPHANRTIIGVIPFQILSAVGLVYLIKLIKNSLFQRILISVIVIVILASFQNYLQKYFYEYPKYSSDYWGWQYGPKEIIKYFLTHRTEYDELYLSSEFNSPEIFLKFYDRQYLCQNCFVGNFTERYNPLKKQLFAISPGQLSPITQGFSSLKIIYKVLYPNKDVAFLLIETKPND